MYTRNDAAVLRSLKNPKVTALNNKDNNPVRAIILSDVTFYITGKILAGVAKNGYDHIHLEVMMIPVTKDGKKMAQIVVQRSGGREKPIWWYGKHDRILETWLHDRARLFEHTLQTRYRGIGLHVPKLGVDSGPTID